MEGVGFVYISCGQCGGVPESVCPAKEEEKRKIEERKEVKERKTTKEKRWRKGRKQRKRSR